MRRVPPCPPSPQARWAKFIAYSLPRINPRTDITKGKRRHTRHAGVRPVLRGIDWHERDVQRAWPSRGGHMIYSAGKPQQFSANANTKDSFCFESSTSRAGRARGIRLPSQRAAIPSRPLRFAAYVLSTGGRVQRPVGMLVKACPDRYIHLISLSLRMRRRGRDNLHEHLCR